MPIRARTVTDQEFDEEEEDLVAGIRIIVAQKITITGSKTGGEIRVPPALTGAVFFDITAYSGFTNVTLDIETASDAEPVNWATAASSGAMSAVGVARDTIGGDDNDATWTGSRIRWKATTSGSGSCEFWVIIYARDS